MLHIFHVFLLKWYIYKSSFEIFCRDFSDKKIKIQKFAEIDTMCLILLKNTISEKNEEGECIVMRNFFLKCVAMVIPVWTKEEIRVRYILQ